MLACALPLVRAQAGVCWGQQRLQVWREFIQLHGEAGEAVVEEVILRLWIYGTARQSGAPLLFGHKECW